jgi:hypothetical protein
VYEKKLGERNGETAHGVIKHGHIWMLEIGLGGLVKQQI